jgi:hypothetical protein
MGCFRSTCTAARYSREERRICVQRHTPGLPTHYSPLLLSKEPLPLLLFFFLVVDGYHQCRKACVYIRDITDAVLCTIVHLYYCFDVAPLIVKDCKHSRKRECTVSTRVHVGCESHRIDLVVNFIVFIFLYF